MEPGDRLLPERQLGEKMNLSRTTVRRGMKILLDSKILFKQGRKTIVHPDAICIIESANKKTVGNLYIVIPEQQYGNTILQNIFTIISNGVSPHCKTEVFSSKRLTSQFIDSLSSDDMLILMGVEMSGPVLYDIEKRVRLLLSLNLKNEDGNFIAPDNYAGGRLMAEALYQSGHRRIGALFADCRLNHEFGERYLGARDYLAERDIELILCDPVNREPGENDVEKHRSLIARMRKEHDLTAIICPYDEIAYIVIDIISDEGGSVPEDLSVVGFDDKIFSSFIKPGLTTVRYPSEAIASKALEVINEALAHSRNICVKEMVKPVLIKRNSIKNIE